MQLFGEEAALQLMRVVGSSLARMAEAFTSTAHVTQGADLLNAPDELDAIRTTASLLAMVHSAERAIALLLRRHLAAAYRRLELMRPALTPSSADILDASIGFADLAGSTQPSPPNRLWEFTAARPYDLTLRVDRHWATAGYIRAVCDGHQQTSLSVHEDGVSRYRRSQDSCPPHSPG